MNVKRGVRREPPAPSEFDRLLGPHARADVVGSGTSMPAPAVVDFSGAPRLRRRAFPLDWFALALAIVAPPVGVALALVLTRLRRGDRGWSSRVATVALAMGVVLSLIVGGLLGAMWIDRENTKALEAAAAEARPLCSALEAEPTLLQSQAFGWPTEVTPLEQTVAAMDEYRAHWADLAAIAPVSIAGRLEAIVDRAATLVSTTRSTLTIDRTANLEAMMLVTDASALPAWRLANCDSTAALHAPQARHARDARWLRALQDTRKVITRHPKGADKPKRLPASRGDYIKLHTSRNRLDLRVVRGL
jgi:hypothetical protein